jgi:hypothetical protein
MCRETWTGVTVRATRIMRYGPPDTSRLWRTDQASLAHVTGR